MLKSIPRTLLLIGYLVLLLLRETGVPLECVGIGGFDYDSHTAYRHSLVARNFNPSNPPHHETPTRRTEARRAGPRLARVC